MQNEAVSTRHGSCITGTLNSKLFATIAYFYSKLIVSGISICSLKLLQLAPFVLLFSKVLKPSNRLLISPTDRQAEGCFVINMTLSEGSSCEGDRAEVAGRGSSLISGPRSDRWASSLFLLQVVLVPYRLQ